MQTPVAVASCAVRRALSVCAALGPGSSYVPVSQAMNRMAYGAKVRRTIAYLSLGTYLSEKLIAYHSLVIYLGM